MVEPTLDWEQVAREAKEIADAHGWNDPPEDDATYAVNNLERIKMGILCEAVALVLSGELDKLEKGRKGE